LGTIVEVSAEEPLRIEWMTYGQAWAKSVEVASGLFCLMDSSLVRPFARTCFLARYSYGLLTKMSCVGALEGVFQSVLDQPPRMGCLRPFCRHAWLDFRSDPRFIGCEGH